MQVFNINMIRKLHTFLPSFTLYFNIENAPNQAQKHFEKTKMKLILS